MERDAENDYLALDTADDDPVSVLQGRSITYRIALGSQAGRKVLTLQTLPPVDMDEMHSGTVGEVAGFNLHAGVAARADERRKLERLCRISLDPRFRHQHRQPGNEIQRLDKIAGSDFVLPKAGPKGGGQEARSNMTWAVPSRYWVFSWLSHVYGAFLSDASRSQIYVREAPQLTGVAVQQLTNAFP